MQHYKLLVAKQDRVIKEVKGQLEKMQLSELTALAERHEIDGWREQRSKEELVEAGPARPDHSEGPRPQAKPQPAPRTTWG